MWTLIEIQFSIQKNWLKKSNAINYIWMDYSSVHCFGEGSVRGVGCAIFVYNSLYFEPNKDIYNEPLL